MSERTHYVYRAFDNASRLLYVGCTGNPAQRRTEHQASSVWIKYATRFAMEGPLEKRAAFTRERAVITAEEPLFNSLPHHKQMVRRRGERRHFLGAEFARVAGLDLDRDYIHGGNREAFHAIWAAAEAVAATEFDPRCTREGRLAYYLSLVEQDQAVAA